VILMRVSWRGMPARQTVLLFGLTNNLLFNKSNITDLLKAFLGNGSVNTVNVQQWKMCLSGRILLRVVSKQRNNEDADRESRDLFSM
jgi:hypothetical protein